MKLIRTAMLAAVCALPAFTADPGLLQFVPSGAKSIAGVYVDRAAGSPMGVFLQSLAGTENRDFQKFIDQTGFDPRRDLREIVMYSPDPQNSKGGVILARGTFRAEQIEALALDKGAEKESHQGVDIYVGMGNGRPSFAFPEPSIAVLGEASAVKAALSNRSQPSVLDPKLAAKAQAASAKYDLWFAGAGPQNIGLGKAWKAQDGVEMVSGGLTLGSVVQLTAEAVMRSEKDAQGLVGLFKMMSGMAQFQQNRNPQTARLFAILNTAETKVVDGTTVQFSISAAQSDLEELFKRPAKVAAVR